MKNNEKIETPIRNLKKDDEVVCGNGKTSKIVCIIKTKIPGQKLAVFKNGLKITLKHPILWDGQWVLPMSVADSFEENTSGEVYCFVLKYRLTAIVNGIECATWGHGLTGEVISHSYYGTEKIIEDLKLLNGWSKGFIEVNGSISRAIVEESLDTQYFKKVKIARRINSLISLKDE